ncbi:MAG TPA: mycoredoxin [Mycobacteriales bacterium]|jgi:mycoredoxin|nr:mycoredoxin [Mycobacteriales bacterium]
MTQPTAESTSTESTTTESTSTARDAVTMYTTVWCGYCQRLKGQLQRAGIAWTEVDIETDPAAAERVRTVNGGNETVPTLEFADGSALTNPSLKQVEEKLATLR